MISGQQWRRRRSPTKGQIDVVSHACYVFASSVSQRHHDNMERSDHTSLDMSLPSAPVIRQGTRRIRPRHHQKAYITDSGSQARRVRSAPQFLDSSQRSACLAKSPARRAPARSPRGAAFIPTRGMPLQVPQNFRLVFKRHQRFQIKTDLNSVYLVGRTGNPLRGGTLGLAMLLQRPGSRVHGLEVLLKDALLDDES